MTLIKAIQAATRKAKENETAYYVFCSVPIILNYPNAYLYTHSRQYAVENTHDGVYIAVYYDRGTRINLLTEEEQKKQL